MAKESFYTVPLDQPHLLREGVMAKESDRPGSAKWIALPPEHPLRAAKGDLGNSVIPGFESHYSKEGGVNKPPPFKLKG